MQEQKVNYQKKLEEVIAREQKAGNVPTLLLHSCCAPCSSYVLEYLSQFFKITVLYYNPNISPETEYRAREEEQKRLITELPTKYPVSFLAGDYVPELFYAAVKGMEFVNPDCVKAVAPYVIPHRLVCREMSLNLNKKSVAEEITELLLDTVPVPTEEIG